MSGTNTLTAPTFHGMNDRSAIVTLSPTRYSCFERTESSTPNTRLISLLYLSTALGIVSGWSFWNHDDCPKYGLGGQLRDVKFCRRIKYAPLTRDLEGEPLEFNVFLLTDAGEFVILVVLVDQVLQDREGLPGF